jgi:hypothetical protein
MTTRTAYEVALLTLAPLTSQSINKQRDVNRTRFKLHEKTIYKAAGLLMPCQEFFNAWQNELAKLGYTAFRMQSMENFVCVLRTECSKTWLSFGIKRLEEPLNYGLSYEDIYNQLKKREFI